ncbi:hypothetical protein ElyMa_001302600 [Elysia marginata]|uniref:Uncharacterized protein n=1 Tax=Elysia marginata TaxID=1093978 RepID=A0AAV4IK74_9GAST|nr:hypothetical protein ElyMa_001302600 [Elysia marginata]
MSFDTTGFSIPLSSTRGLPARRASKFSRFFKKIGKGIKTAAKKVGGGIQKAAKVVNTGIKKVTSSRVGRVLGGSMPWLYPLSTVTYVVAATVDEERAASTKEKIWYKKAQYCWQRQMMTLGDDVGKRDSGSKAKGFKSIIQAIRDAGQRAINAGKKVIKNSDKIKAAFKDAVADISAVVKEGVADVGAALADVGDSISKAGKSLESAKTSGDNVNDGIGESIEELKRAGEKAIEAGKEFEEVGRRSIDLVKRILKLGKNIVQVFGKAAKNIVKASGITGKK